MDQQALRALEYRCIQEEPPWCIAACPLHVDIRGFVGHIGHGRWADAWKVLRKHLPVPGILGRICDAPCEARCKRQEAGGAVRIGALERACVGTDPPALRVQRLPSKGKTVAVAGSGLSSLTVAWDLVRKGYAVTVFESRDAPGASLLCHGFNRLPAVVIASETSVLTRWGVQFECGSDPETPAVVAHCLGAFDAVYLGLDAVAGGLAWDAGRGGDGVIRINPGTGETSREGLFAGGRTDSLVWQATQGRWAATSIDRFLQGVSLTAGRDRDGPFETRLFTSLAGVAPLPPVAMADADAGYAPAEAEAEALRCLQCECLECVKACDYLKQFRAYPKKYAREVYNNLSIVMGEHKANRLINSCSLCGLCEQICPNDFAMQDLCLSARQILVDTGKMPPSAHEFALLDMAFSQSPRFSMARHQPGYNASAHVFFPGCQLCASAPGQVDAVYAHLRGALAGGVGLMLGCCAAPAHWAGRRELFDAAAAKITESWDAMGRPGMILACSTCLRMFKDHLPTIPTRALWSVLETHPAAAAAARVARPLAIHDPCTTRAEAELQACIRRLLAGAGCETEELVLGREKTECCGFGGLMQNANPQLAREVIRHRAQRSDSDYITYCAMCRDTLAAAGKRVIHLLDLFFPDPDHPEPALRPRPGWSRRQENRARLKARLLESLWGEVSEENRDHPPVTVKISPEVAERLDKRRVLIDDLKQVIAHAEASGERFFHSESGHYIAAHTPYKVTFWVEYAPVDGGFAVYNAYTHRMAVLGP
ncbi:MAG: pyridine nucleotide-disulfide oxidoreductase/dicluster-binding protein [Pseudomonadota bacterium]